MGGESATRSCRCMRGGTARDVLSSRLDLCDLEEILELRDRPVGHSDRLRLALVVDLSTDTARDEKVGEVSDASARAQRGANRLGLTSSRRGYTSRFTSLSKSTSRVPSGLRVATQTVSWLSE